MPLRFHIFMKGNRNNWTYNKTGYLTLHSTHIWCHFVTDPWNKGYFSMSEKESFLAAISP